RAGGGTAAIPVMRSRCRTVCSVARLCQPWERRKPYLSARLTQPCHTALFPGWRSLEMPADAQTDEAGGSVGFLRCGRHRFERVAAGKRANSTLADSGEDAELHAFQHVYLHADVQRPVAFAGVIAAAQRRRHVLADRD